MKIKKRLQYVTTAAVVAVAVMGTLVVTYATEYYEAVSLANELEVVSRKAFQLQVITGELVLRRNTRTQDQWREISRNMSIRLRGLADTITPYQLEYTLGLVEQIDAIFDQLIQVDAGTQRADLLERRLLRNVPILPNTILTIVRDAEEDILGKLQRLVLVCSSAALALCMMLVASHRFAKGMLVPLAQLESGIRGMRAGAFRTPIDLGRDDEIGELSRLFDDMRQDLGMALEANAKANRTLLEANSELEQFAYTASHDLRAPLVAVRRLAEFLTADLKDGVADDPEEVADNLRLMSVQVARMDNLLEDLLQYARLGSTQQDREAVDVREITQHAVDLLDPPSDFSVALPAPLTVNARRVELEMILRNLIGNAIKHHDRTDGHIRVGVDRDADSLVIEVEDDGPGIPEEYRERVFQLFATLKSRDKVEGSGMGLALVRKLATRSGGAASMTSAGERGALARVVYKLGDVPA